MPKQSRPSMLLKAFRFPPGLWAQVEQLCDDRDLNPSDAVREAVTEWVERQTPPTPPG